MLVWNHNGVTEPLIGFGVKEATIEYSVDGTAWTRLGESQTFGRASGKADYAFNTTIDFGGAAAKFVRITAVSNWGGLLKQYGLSEVRFLYIPVSARQPQPAADAKGVAPQHHVELASGKAGGQARGVPEHRQAGGASTEPPRS